MSKKISADSLIGDAEDVKWNTIFTSLKEGKVDFIDLLETGTEFYGEWFVETLKEHFWNIELYGVAEEADKWALRQTDEYKKYVELKKKFEE
jgi:hypothetical protein